MFEKNSKFPRFFILMLIPIAIVMFVGMFFSARFVGNSYFIALIIVFVFLMLDRHHGENLTNYKLAFFIIDFINLIAVIAVLYYEFTKYSLLLNVFLISLIVLLLILTVIDGIMLTNKDISKRSSILVNLTNFAAMICILTYFYEVSDLFFAIDAVLFMIGTIVAKIMLIYKRRDKKEEKANEFDLVSIIREEEEADVDWWLLARR